MHGTWKNQNAVRKYQICKQPKQMAMTHQHSLSEHMEIADRGFGIIPHTLHDLFMVTLALTRFTKGIMRPNKAPSTWM